ncbi:acyl-homoserine-lactone synthase [Cochlodiniinecator piscidefendens]|uniref:acyl-homoserine-lactone synthase n=1 Tax=Cochlodiniinecator piscidefendens TaxID=2715756 RepID=UPI00140C5E34|nr:acyl-homoserine-lactone synthase [Cochlodiniinecator piscidefendens]
MLRYIPANQMNLHPKLRDTMFRDRADQFKTRLGWEVSVDTIGMERDEYDAMNPLYVIWEQEDGSHGGSMRFMPTTGRTMVNDHFSYLNGDRLIQSDDIWECTRFCIARGMSSKISSALMLGGAEIGIGFGLSHSVGVFDDRMVRIYARLGWGPTILGAEGEGRGRISVGLWEFSDEVRNRLLLKSGVSSEASSLWFRRAFGEQDRLAKIA